MITQEEAIALAREVMDDPEDGEISGLFLLEPDELTALCNKVRKKTLLEAAEWYERPENFGNPAFVLRRMAGEE